MLCVLYCLECLADFFGFGFQLALIWLAWDEFDAFFSLCWPIITLQSKCLFSHQTPNVNGMYFTWNEVVFRENYPRKSNLNTILANKSKNNGNKRILLWFVDVCKNVSQNIVTDFFACICKYWNWLAAFVSFVHIHSDCVWHNQTTNWNSVSLDYNLSIRVWTVK